MHTTIRCSRAASHNEVTSVQLFSKPSRYIRKWRWIICTGDNTHLPVTQNPDSERDLMEGTSKQQQQQQQQQQQHGELSEAGKRYSYMNSDNQLHVGGPSISSCANTGGGYTDTLTYKKVSDYRCPLLLLLSLLRLPLLWLIALGKFNNYLDLFSLMRHWYLSLAEYCSLDIYAWGISNLSYIHKDGIR